MMTIAKKKYIQHTNTFIIVDEFEMNIQATHTQHKKWLYDVCLNVFHFVVVVAGLMFLTWNEIWYDVTLSFDWWLLLHIEFFFCSCFSHNYDDDDDYLMSGCEIENQKPKANDDDDDDDIFFWYFLDIIDSSICVWNRQKHIDTFIHTFSGLTFDFWLISGIFFLILYHLVGWLVCCQSYG